MTNVLKGFAPLLGVAAIAFAGTANAQYCTIAENSSALLPVDVSKLEMYGDGKEISARITMATGGGAHPSANYWVRWFDESGKEWYLRATTNPVDEALNGGAFFFGHFEETATGSSYVDDGPATGSISGDQIIITATSLGLGSPKTIEVVSTQATSIGLGTLSVGASTASTEWKVTTCSDGKTEAVPAKAGSCAVAEDGTFDEFGVLGYDLTGLSMFTDGDNVGGTISVNVDAMAGPAGLFDLLIETKSTTYFLEADTTIPGLPAFVGGTYDGEDWNYIDGFPVTGSISGADITLQIPRSAIGNASGNVTVEAISFMALTAVDYTDPAIYTIGDSCAKAADYYGVHYSENQNLQRTEVADHLDAADTTAAAAGSLGGSFLLMLGLFGLRRKRG